MAETKYRLKNVRQNRKVWYY